MIFISDSIAFVQSISLPESVGLKLFPCRLTVRFPAQAVSTLVDALSLAVDTVPHAGEQGGHGGQRGTGGQQRLAELLRALTVLLAIPAFAASAIERG